MNFPRYGDVYYVKLGRYVGVEQAAGRPAIIVSNDFGNRHSEVVEVVYLTTQFKNPLPTHVHIKAQPGLKESTALCEQICTVSKTRLTNRCAHLDDDTMDQVRTALRISLNIPGTNAAETCKYIERLVAENESYRKCLEDIETLLERRDTNGDAATTAEACSQVQTAQAVQTPSNTQTKRQDLSRTKGFRLA